MRHSFGVLQPVQGQELSIPGTSMITTSIRKPLQDTTSAASGSTEHDIVLVPRPTDDPNDPLNWTPKEKRLILVTIGFASAVIHTLGPMMSTSYLQIAKEYHQSLDKVTQVISGNFALTSGLGTLLVSAFGICYGKRPAFVYSTAIITFLTLWLALEKKFVSMAVARAFQGIATAPLEVLVTGAVADLYFVHERGSAMAIIGAMMLLSILSSQIMGGFAVQFLGFRSLFWITAALTGALVPLLFFLVPETSWLRSRSVCDPMRVNVQRPLDTSDIELVETSDKDQAGLAKSHKICGERCGRECHMDRLRTTLSRKSWSERLKLWNGRIDNQSYWMACIRPMLLLYHPAVIFGIFVHGLGSTYLHAFAFAKLRLFSAPPYNLTPCKTVWLP